MKKFFKKMLDAIDDVLFKNYKCMFCDRETNDEFLICDNCKSKLKFINNNICNKCGSATDEPEAVCYDCFNKNYVFDSHRSCIFYDNYSSRPVKALKYSKQKYLAEPIARFMFETHKEIFHDIDYITFVPMTRVKEETRGYNHTEVITHELSKLSGIPVMNFIIKNRDTGDQARLGFDERNKNLKGSFEVDKDKKDLLKDKNVLLIDDVFTTGSTSNECSKVLLKAKAHSVVVATFLKTNPHDENQDFSGIDEN